MLVSFVPFAPLVAARASFHVGMDWADLASVFWTTCRTAPVEARLNQIPWGTCEGLCRTAAIISKKLWDSFCRTVAIISKKIWESLCHTAAIYLMKY